MFKLKLVEKKSHYNTFSRKVKQPIGQSAYFAFLFVKLYLIFFGYLSLEDSLQAVLLLMPKNVCESCITNDICQVEHTERFSWSTQGNGCQAHMDALG